MPWTESRTRDEWLAEVRQRGERIRRRRRLALSGVCAVALLGPAFALVSRTSGGIGDRQLRVAAGGPSSTAGATGPSVPTAFGEGDAIPTTTALAGAEPLPEVTAPSGPLFSSTTTAVPRRESSVRRVPPADDPVVRPTTAAPSGNSSSPAQGQLQSSGAASASTESAPAPCVAADFRLTLSVDKSAYGPGETVEGSSTLEKRADGRCLWPAWAVEFRILDGAGRDVFEAARSYGGGSSFEQPPPRCESGPCGPPTVGPGTVLTGHFRWESCTNPWPIVAKDEACVPFPPGTYTVVADWTGPEGGPPARKTFDIGP